MGNLILIILLAMLIVTAIQQAVSYEAVPCQGVVMMGGCVYQIPNQ